MRPPFLVTLLVTTMMALAGHHAAWSQEYVVMGTPLVNIRTGPSTEHAVVGRAEKGDIFKVVGTVGEWIAIEMFTSDQRYVTSASYVYPLERGDLLPGHRMALADSVALLRPVYQDVVAAQRRAQREAEEFLPQHVDEERHSHLRRVIEDRMILETLHIHGVQPALYDDLVDCAMDSQW